MEVVFMSENIVDYGPNCIGNVIRILDERTVIVNAGSESLNVGDKIVIYTVVEPLYDLDGSLLSMFEYSKDTLEVIDTNTKYSICKKMKTRKTKYSGLASAALAISPLLMSEGTEYVPLNVDSGNISPLKEIDPKIHLGDPIRLV